MQLKSSVKKNNTSMRKENGLCSIWISGTWVFNASNSEVASAGSKVNFFYPSPLISVLCKSLVNIHACMHCCYVCEMKNQSGEMVYVVTRSNLFHMDGGGGRDASRD